MTGRRQTPIIELSWLYVQVHPVFLAIKSPENTILFDWIKEVGRLADWLVHADCFSSVWYSSQKSFVLTCFLFSLLVHSAHLIVFFFYKHAVEQKKVLLTCCKDDLTKSLQSGLRLPCGLLCEHWHLNLSPQRLVHLLQSATLNHMWQCNLPLYL